MECVLRLLGYPWWRPKTGIMTEKKTLNGGVIPLGNYGTIRHSVPEDKVNILQDDSTVSVCVFYWFVDCWCRCWYGNHNMCGNVGHVYGMFMACLWHVYMASYIAQPSIEWNMFVLQLYGFNLTWLASYHICLALINASIWKCNHTRHICLYIF